MSTNRTLTLLMGIIIALTVLLFYQYPDSPLSAAQHENLEKAAEQTENPSVAVKVTKAGFLVNEVPIDVESLGDAIYQARNNTNLPVLLSIEPGSPSEHIELVNRIIAGLEAEKETVKKQ